MRNHGQLLHAAGPAIAEQLATDPSTEPALSTENTTPRSAAAGAAAVPVPDGIEAKLALLLGEMTVMRREIAELRASGGSTQRKNLAA